MRPSMADATAPRFPVLSADVIGGVTTFFTMAYIVVVNPAILSTEGTGVPFAGALTATVFIACSMTLLMGLYAKLPFAVAPGMGLNAFFAFTIVLQGHVPWRTALGMVFWAGVLFVASFLIWPAEQRSLWRGLFSTSDAEISDLPLVGDLSLSLKLPAYTGLPPREVRGGDGTIRALKGTTVVLRATADRNVRATEQAIKMTARGGTVTLVGMAPQAQAASFDPLLFVQRETRMLGCFYGSFRPKLDFQRYVNMVVSGQLKVKEMISRRYALEEINEAYDRLGRGEVARSVISFPH